MNGYTFDKALELAQKFCAADDGDYPERYKKPCAVDRYVCATNGRMAIRVELDPIEQNRLAREDFAAKISSAIDDARRDASAPFALADSPGLDKRLQTADADSYAYAWSEYNDAYSVTCPHCGRDFRVSSCGEIIEHPDSRRRREPEVRCTIDFPGDPAVFNWRYIKAVLDAAPKARWCYKRNHDGIFGKSYMLYAYTPDGPVCFVVMGMLAPDTDAAKYPHVKAEAAKEGDEE